MFVGDTSRQCREEQVHSEFHLCSCPWRSDYMWSLLWTSHPRLWAEPAFVLGPLWASLEWMSTFVHEGTHGLWGEK